MRTSFLTLLFLFIFSSLPAISDYYYFKQISLENGLTQSTVQSVAKDHKGYIWLGTKAGLNRYDQNELKTFVHNPEDTLSLPGNRITFITEDNNLNLWVSTNNGLACFDRSSEQFRLIRVNGNVVVVGDFLIQDDGVLFCGKDALFKYDYTNRTFSKLQLSIEDPASTFFNTLLKWDEDRILIGSRWNGLWIYRPKENRITRATFYTQKDIMSMFIDSKQQVWISPYGSGVECFSPEGKFIAEYNTHNSELSNDIILDMEEKEDQIWFATDGGGISILNKATGHFSVIEPIPGDIYSFPANSIFKLYKDQHNNMWAGTIRGGLIGIKKVFVKTYKDVALNSPYGTSDKTILSLCEDEKHIWIGTDGGGINRFDPDTETFCHYPSTYKDKIASIVNFGQQELLVSVFSKGVYRFNKQTGLTKPFTLVSEADNQRICRSSKSVNIARISPSEYLFLGDNVYHYDTHNDSFSIIRLKASKYITSASMQYICTDGPESYLFGQRNLFVLDHQKKIISPIFTLSREHGTINAVTHHNGLFWLGTTTGLYFYDPQLKVCQKINTRLFHEVSSIISEPAGRLWVAAQGMLFSYSILQNKFSILDESDGVYPNEFLNKPVLCSRLGDIYMGGVTGLARIKNMPQQITASSSEVDLTDVIINGNSMYETIDSKKPVVTLPWNYSSLLVKMMANKEDIFRRKMYRYRISGRNSTPVETYDNTIKLHTLSPGSYTVEASCNTGDGAWSTPKLLLTIIITPPWWKNGWIILLLLLILLTATGITMYWLMERKEVRLKWQMKEHEQKIYEEKVRFLINISHELRTPLTLIYAPLKRMLDKAPLTPDTQRQLSRIYKQTKQMRNIINMVLDMRKMEAAENTLHLTSQSLNQWIFTIAEDFGHEFRERDITLTYNFGTDIPDLWFDTKRCETILSNLLINALKFSESKTTITVSTSIRDEYVRVSVKDQGIGLNEVDVDKLFTRFYQGSNHDQPGTGIGLSYAKTLIEMHHGSIGAFNNEGEPGATFYFELPLKQDTIEISTHRTALLNETFDDTTESVQPADITLMASSTLLIVEDEPDLRRFLVEVLSEKFQTIYEADNGADALILIQREIPDIVISDIMMPQMNGLQLCKKVKENADLCHIPFILLTAKTDSESMLMSYKTGADIYLAKPFDLDILEARIFNLLKNKNSMKERYKKYGLNAEIETPELRNADEQFIIRLNDIIGTHLDNTDLDVKFITEEMGMSRATLYGKMKTLIGMGVNDYINKHRIAKASHLLNSTTLPIQEISNMCGFSNQRYFSTVFKQATGFTPSRYREEASEKEKIDA